MAQDDSDMRTGAPGCPEPIGPDARGIDWSRVWHDYVYSGEAVKRIAWRHGTTATTVRKRVYASGWARIVPMSPRPPGRRAGPRSGEPPTASERRRSGLINRLFKMLDAIMSEIEARMRKGAPERSAADAERDMRTITTIMQAYAKAVALDDAARAGEGGGSDSGDGIRTNDDADRLRRDLADRLARLRSGGDI